MAVEFLRRHSGGREAEYLADCAALGAPSDGAYTGRLQDLFASELHGREIIFTPSCSHALELACHLLKLEPGDEVILPSFNFPSAANAVILAGGTPVLCDVDGDTQNISIQDMVSRITPRTKAVIAVHYASLSCEMDALVDEADRRGIDIIEDAAQAVGAKYRGRTLGTMGRFGAYSFHYTKNFSCGEGGALVLGPSDTEGAHVFRDKGTNRRSFLRGDVSKYTWVGKGSSVVMSELLAASLLSQMEEMEGIRLKRMGIHNIYMEELEAEQERGTIKLMKVPGYSMPNGHIFYILLRNYDMREKVRLGLLESGIDARSHYVPLHHSQMGRRLGYLPEDLKYSTRAYECLLRLPMHTKMTHDDARTVCEMLRRELKNV